MQSCQSGAWASSSAPACGVRQRFAGNFHRSRCVRPPHAASQDASLKSGAELSAGPLTVSVPERSQRNGIALKASVSVAETEAPTTLAGIKLPHRPSSNSAAAGAAHAGGLDSRGRLDASAWGAANADGSAQHLHDDGFEAMLDDHLQPLRNWHTDARGRGPQASTSASTNRAPFIDVISSPPAGVGAAFNRAAKSGDFHRALQILEACVAANRHDMIVMFNHKDFLHTAAERKAVMEALCFIQLLPRAFADARTHNMTLHVCAKARDLKTALQVVTLMDERGIKIDVLHYTTLITACGAVGNTDRAFRLFQDLKLSKQRPDSQAYGALIAAFASAVQRDVRVSSDKREQLVLLERAMLKVEDASRGNAMMLELPVWNALIALAARSGQLDRAFQVVDMMSAKGVKADATTYGTLIDACVAAKEEDMARRLYVKAIAEGHTRSCKLYTAAINACMVGDSADIDAALEIHSRMQASGVEADDLLYGNLIAVAGKAGRFNLAFDILNDMLAGGVAPGQATCSALIFACLKHGSLAAVKRVYSTLKSRGVYPSAAQYNALMEQYARNFRLGEVAMLLQDMMGPAGLTPTVNTYRVLLIACQRTDQIELAFEILHLMKSRGVAIKDAFGQSIVYSLLKMCFNRMRTMWRAVRYPAMPSATPAVPAVRMAEARVLLTALSAGAGFRSAGFLTNNALDNMNWASLALATYRDAMAAGFQPKLHVLDMLMACLRLQYTPPHVQEEAEALAAGGEGSDFHLLHELRTISREMALSNQDARSEFPFDKRALALIDEAVSRGVLPSYKVDDALSIDMRSMPPTIAEVYVHAILNAVEQRVGSSGRFSAQRITFLVPAFDADLVMWPSYVEKLNRHYSEVTATAADAARSARRTRNAYSQWVDERDRARAAAEAARLASGAGIGSEDMMDYDEDDEYADLSDDIFDSLSSSGGSHGATSSGRFGSRDSMEEDDHYTRQLAINHFQPATAVTGLAVAATCRRAKIFARIKADEGIIAIVPREFNRWVKNKQKAEDAKAFQEKLGGGGGSGVGAPVNLSGPGGVSVAEQQRAIRMGMAPPAPGRSSGRLQRPPL